jgi:hypothetical protein
MTEHVQNGEWLLKMLVSRVSKKGRFQKGKALLSTGLSEFRLRLMGKYRLFSPLNLV